MGGSYKQCNGCGKRALSIATRCPGCGRELTAPATREGRPARNLGRFRSPGVAAAVLAAAAVLLVAKFNQSSGIPKERRSPVAADSIASSQLGYATAPTNRLDTAGVAAPADSAELLVTRTWTNVRKSRSGVADLEAVLLPGDTVLADSLVRGWYRVALEGKVLGYTHRSTLTTLGKSTVSPRSPAPSAQPVPVPPREARTPRPADPGPR
jgi:hypothetical protein